jgi:hypothetical protein
MKDSGIGHKEFIDWINNLKEDDKEKFKLNSKSRI